MSGQSLNSPLQKPKKSNNAKKGRGKNNVITKEICCVETCNKKIIPFGDVIHNIFPGICKNLCKIIGEYSHWNEFGVIMHKSRREFHIVCFPCHNNIIKFVGETNEIEQKCPKKNCSQTIGLYSESQTYLKNFV